MAELEIQRIKPGILVTEHVRREGGIRYQRVMKSDLVQDESRIREWETRSIIANETEYRTRTNLISSAYHRLRGVCANTSVGLICPQSKETDLREAVAAIHASFDEFNQSSKTCRVMARYGFFQVEELNQAAIAAVSDQIAEMATKVESALVQSDLDVLRHAPARLLNGKTPEQILDLPEAEKGAILARVRAEGIRSAIGEAKGLDALVPDEVSKEVQGVIKHARTIARQLCRRVQKEKEAIDDVLGEVDLSGIRRMRSAFVASAAKADQKAIEETSVAPEAPIVVSPAAQIVQVSQTLQSTEG